jgi:putative thioredoxin
LGTRQEKIKIIPTQIRKLSIITFPQLLKFNPQNPMGQSLSVNQQTFVTEVLERSYQHPVLVDFFATWCGPCQMLKPMLEKLLPEYDMTLAKVDIDESPDLAQQYGVSGVPDVRVVINGVVQTGFVGVLPEPQLREMMNRLQVKAGLNQQLDRLYAMAEAGDVDTAEIELRELLASNPGDGGLILEAANFYMEANNLEEAETLLGKIPQHEKEFAARARGMQALVEFKRAIASEIMSPLDQQYRDSSQAALEQNYETALQGFLTIVETDRLYRNDAARRSMLALFDLLGNDNPLTNAYRKKLMMAIY